MSKDNKSMKIIGFILVFITISLHLDAQITKEQLSPKEKKIYTEAKKWAQ